MNKYFGIDISTYQRGIDLKTAGNEGVEFAIIRGGFTGYGTGKNKAIDDTFEIHYKNAKDNNLGVGVYYFSRATSYEEGKSEAEFLYNNCLKGKTFEYPIYIDVEDDVYQKNAGKVAVTNAIKGFCEYLEEKKFYVGVYCNLNWANNYMNYNELIQDYDFWLAYWGSEMPKRTTYGSYGLWQFGGETNTLRSNKISGRVCDQNYAYKDYPKIMLNNGLNNFVKPVIEKPKDEPIVVPKSDIDEKPIEEEIIPDVTLDEEVITEKEISIFNKILKLLKKFVDYVISKLKL